MRHIQDMLTIPPSTSPPLTAVELEKLPPGGVFHFNYNGGRPIKLELEGSEWTLRSWLPPAVEFRGQAWKFRNLEGIADCLRSLRLARLPCIKTEQQVRDRTKTVTRRLSATGMEAGALLNLTDGSRQPGVLVIGTVVVEDVSKDLLWKMDPGDLALEGFPDMHITDFLRMFEDMHGLRNIIELEVYRIQFRYL